MGGKEVLEISGPGTISFELNSNDLLNAHDFGLAIQGHNFKITSYKIEATGETMDLPKEQAYIPYKDLFHLYCLTTPGGTDFYNNRYEGIQMDAIPVSELSPIIGTHGKFSDGVHKKDGMADMQCNLREYWKEDIARVGVEYTIPADETTLSLEYIAGATVYFNSFGYYYYDENDSPEERMRKPKIILMLDAFPGNALDIQNADQNFAVYNSKASFSDARNDKDENWGNYGMITDIRVKDKDEYGNWDKWGVIQSSMNKSDAGGSVDRVVPRHLDLVYYPEEKNTETGEITLKTNEGTLNFPPGKKVAFFGITNGAFILADTGNNLTLGNHSFTFSRPWMNGLFGNTTDFNNHTHKEEYRLDKDGNKLDDIDIDKGYVTGPDQKPSIAMALFEYNGDLIIGAEDTPNGKDHDMNDMLFRLSSRKGIEEIEIPEVPVEEPKLQSWILAAEDLGDTDDMDYNDMVVGISYLATDEAGGNKVYLKPLSAGGTLPIRLGYKHSDGTATVADNNSGETEVNVDDIDFIGDGAEFHSFFNNSASTVMVNTSGSNHIEADVIELQLNSGETFSLTSEISNSHKIQGEEGLYNFYLEVTKNEETYILNPPKPGLAPRMMLLPVTWKYPTERTHITKAYNLFNNWVNDKTNDDWYSKPDNSVVIDHGWKGHSLKK